MQSGQTPLYIASFHGHQKCAQLLIKAGANINVPKPVSMTMYMHAHIS